MDGWMVITRMSVGLTMVMMTMVALHNGQHRISAPNGTITPTLVLATTTNAQQSTADKCIALDHLCCIALWIVTSFGRIPSQQGPDQFNQRKGFKINIASSGLWTEETGRDAMVTFWTDVPGMENNLENLELEE